MFTIIAYYGENSLITDLPKAVYDLRDEFASIGYTKPLREIPVMSDEDELEINVSPQDAVGQAVLQKCRPEDTLLMLNTVAEYQEMHEHQFTAEMIQALEADGLHQLYCKLSTPQCPVTEKPVLNMLFVRRAEDFTPSPCVIEQVIPLPQEEFFQLRNRPLEQHPLMEQYYDAMLSEDDGTRHGILVYDEVQGDGLLISADGADYARYAQYVPCARELMDVLDQRLGQSQEQETDLSELSL